LRLSGTPKARVGKGSKKGKNKGAFFGESSDDESDDDSSVGSGSTGSGRRGRAGSVGKGGRGKKNPMGYLEGNDSDSDSMSDTSDSRGSSIGKMGGSRGGKGVTFDPSLQGELGRYMKKDDKGDTSNLTNSGKPRKKSKKQEDIERGRLNQRERDSRQTAAQKENQLSCPNCGSKEIEYDEKSGSAICITCGVVVEENAIVSR